MKYTIAIDVDALRYHAQRLEDIADEIAEASAAAASTRMHSEAFGVMCSFLVPPTQIASVFAGRMIDETHELMEHTARSVRKVASEQEEHEMRLVAGIRAIETMLR